VSEKAGAIAVAERHAVLIVDESRTNLAAYRAILEPLGRDIVTATSGPEAVDLLARQQFALLLIDVRFPEIDGFATVELLRRQLHRLTPVVFVTGGGDDETMRRAYDFGAVDYLVKPVQSDVLRGKARNLLAMYEMGMELRRHDTNIGVVAHDLRNPLSAIRTCVTLLRSVPDATDMVASVADMIDRSVQRMTTMIEDVFDFARGRVSGGISLTRGLMDMGSVSHSIAQEISAAHAVARIEVKTAGRLTGEWDQARIERAMSNLFANAVEHGGGAVTVTAVGERDHVVVTVWNDGEPIPAERLPLLFEPFQKGDRSPGGLGLGLFIVREIVRAHDGTVAVSSSATAGTMFTVRLPRGTRPVARVSLRR
jgi:signal transduction histidine kinase